MSVLINDVKELACKFKGHYASSEDIDKITSNSEQELRTSCKRCSFNIVIKLDKENSDYYIVDEIH